MTSEISITIEKHSASGTGRLANPYSTRQYQYLASGGAALAAPALSSGSVYRFVMGRDQEPTELDPSTDKQGPADPFWTHVLRAGQRPTTLEALLRVIPAALDNRKSFVVGDGSQIPWSPETRDIPRALRLVVACGTSGSIPPILISTAPKLDDTKAFLQLVAWDELNGAHQFYDRRNGAWIWAGSSWDSFDPLARGKGPFDSHVNGALNMKELEAPWLHWHSMAARIQDEVLAPDDPFRASNWWRERRPAHELENDVVRPGIARWMASRLERSLRDGKLTSFPDLFRHLTHTTTINLVTSPQESRATAQGRSLLLPISWLVDRGGLIDTLALDPDLEVPEVPGDVYAQTLADFGVKLAADGFEQVGDTHFAFAVPTRAFEDTVVLRELVQRRVISARCAAAVLMVDFTNPIFSARREALLAYAPAEALPGDPDSLEAALVRAIRATGRHDQAGSPEAELLANLTLAEGNWRSVYERRVEALFQVLRPAWSTAAGFVDLFRLAESRRREFKRRPLSEFPLTLAHSNIPDDAPLLRLTENAVIEPK